MNEQTVLAKPGAKVERGNVCSRSETGKAGNSLSSKLGEGELKGLENSLSHSKIAMHPLNRAPAASVLVGKLLIQALNGVAWRDTLDLHQLRL